MKTIYWFLFFLLFHNFSVLSQDIEQLKKQKPFAITGGLSLQGQIYSMGGAPARQPWNSYILSGTPTVSLYGIQFPFSFTLSNNQRDFRQPFNQLGVSPTYKWVKVHAGYRSVSFSQYGLAGHMIFGGGFELTPKKFRFSVMYGRSNKAVAEDTTKTISQNLNSINYPAYKQMLLAVKMGVGTQNNFFDVYFLKGKDDTTSLKVKPQKTEVLPAENLVVGFVHKFSFFKNKLDWQSEAAGSVFTRDISVMQYDISSIKQANLIRSVMTPNYSTSLYTAMESQMKFKHKYFTLGAKYKRIDPDYKSMGAYFFQSDLEQMTGTFTARLFKNKLNLNGSYGVQNDNIARKKIATTQRNIYSFVANCVINKHFGIDFNVSNYGTAQRAGTKSLSDTTRINQISSSYTITPHVFFQRKNKAHTILLILGNQVLNDRNTFTSTYTQMTMLFSNLNYSLTDMEKKTSYLFGVNYNQSTTVAGQIGMLGASVGSSKSFLKDKLSSDVNLIVNTTQFNGASNGILTTLSSGNTYTLSKKQTIRLQLNWLLNQSKNTAAGNSFNEFTGMIQYRHNF